MGARNKPRKVILKKSGQILEVAKVVGESWNDPDAKKHKNGVLVVRNPDYVPNPSAHIEFLYIHPDDVEEFKEVQTSLDWGQSIRAAQDREHRDV